MDPESQSTRSSQSAGALGRAGLAAWEKVAAGAWLMLALSLMERLWPQWGFESYYFYGWAVLPCVCFFFVERLRSAPPRGAAERGPGYGLWMAGCALCVAARWLALSSRDWRLVLLGYGLGVCAAGFGLLLLMGGREWAKYFAIPLMLLLLAVPWPSFFEAAIVDKLTTAVVSLVAGVLKLAGMTPEVAGQFMKLDGISIEIADACSGIRSFQALFALALMLGEVHRLSTRWRLLLVGLATAIGFVANTLRAFVLVLAARMPDGALERYHDLAGYLSVGISFLALILLADRVAPMSRLKVGAHGPGPDNRMAAAFVLLCVMGVLALPELYYALVRPVNAGSNKAPWSLQSASLADRPGTASIDLSAHREMLLFDSGYGVTFPLAEREAAVVYSFEWTRTERGLFKSLGHTPDFCMGCAGAPLLESVFVHEFRVPGAQTPVPMEVYRFYDPMNGRPVDVFRLLWNGRVIDSQHERTHRSRFRRAVEGVRNPSGNVWLLYVGIVGSSDWENTLTRAQAVIQDCLNGGP